MRLPRGELVRSRVVADPATTLADALDRSLTGYAVLRPQDSLLLADDGHGVLTFEDGVPVVAYHATTDSGGPAALADLAEPGPYAAELYRLPADELAAAHDADALRVAPGTPAERLGGDPELADRTRAAAPTDRDGGTGDPVASFLDDDEKIAAIRKQARAEAERRAAEWGLRDAVDRE
jgi:hypothetical protein